MLDPAVGVKTDLIQWFSNGIWKMMPHRHFFVNNLNEHFRHSNRHMPTDQKKVWQELYRLNLLKHQVVVVNHIKFRVQPEIQQRGGS